MEKALEALYKQRTTLETKIETIESILTVIAETKKNRRTGKKEDED